ncbi:unnamed protein product [Ostreobium quekettii]|uniref:Uncharacterized protein n=1 Tax=Ostreobium quekettii TaxID=121088 RepID=A0A8S1IN06_9CHLO|nr:unnamed protein product [Ostreobium quekettii]
MLSTSPSPSRCALCHPILAISAFSRCAKSGLVSSSSQSGCHSCASASALASSSFQSSFSNSSKVSSSSRDTSRRSRPFWSAMVSACQRGRGLSKGLAAWAAVLPAHYGFFGFPVLAMHIILCDCWMGRNVKETK